MGDRARKNNLVANQVCEQRWIAHCQELHRQRLSKVKASIDNTLPFQAPHIDAHSNPKKREQKAERQKAIDMDNKVLLEKLMKIHNSDSTQAIRPFLGRSAFRWNQGQYFDPVTGTRCVDHINPMACSSIPSSPKASRSRSPLVRSRIQSARSVAQSLSALEHSPALDKPGSVYLLAAYGKPYQNNLRPTTASPYSASAPTTPTRIHQQRPWSTPNPPGTGALSVFSDPLSGLSPPSTPSRSRGASRFQQLRTDIESDSDFSPSASPLQSPAHVSSSGSDAHPSLGGPAGPAGITIRTSRLSPSTGLAVETF